MTAPETDRSDPQKRLRLLAEISTARACGFAGLAVFCLMVGLSANAAAALKAGGYSALLVTLVLLLKARQAGEMPYKRTELWLMLSEAERPPAAYAQSLLARVRREVFLRFAAWHAIAAAGMLLAAFVVELSGRN